MDDQVAELQRELPHSIELQRAKDGTYYWTVKIYWEIGQEQATISRLENMDACLRDLFLAKLGQQDAKGE